jgi:hypothetical protein
VRAADDDRTRTRRLLRWYPRQWRDRYGDELAAFLEDTYGQGPVPRRARIDLVRAATVERVRRFPFAAHASLPEERVRGGALLVLWGWALVVVGGTILAKFADNWKLATPPSARLLPTVSYDAVVGAAAVGAVVIAAAVLTVLPSFGRFLRGGGWRQARRPLMGAAAVTVVTVVVGSGVVVWAHAIGPVARNGGSWPYTAAFVVLVGLFVATVMTWTGVSAAVVGRLDLSGRVLAREGRLALGLTGVMVVVTGATVAWWAALATRAPRVLSGAPAGAAGTRVPAALVVAGLCLVAGVTVALRGAGRVRQALPGTSSI